MSYTNGLDKPSDYFSTLIYTGNGSSPRSITGVGFQPDFNWTKSRSAGGSHVLANSVSGANKQLVSNNNSSEATNGVYGYLSAFDSDGWTMTTGSSDMSRMNSNSTTYVSWNWKAGTSFTNDASSTGIGSRDSVGSFNNDAGFSITTLTTAGSGADTYKHGLNTTPSLMIAKTRSSANGWFVFHKDIGNTKFLRLETTGAETTNTMWNNTSPTSSVFSLNADNIGSSVTAVVYSFCEKKGYSKFGSYVGNGNADGPFIFTGFKPAMVICKKSSASGTNWGIIDNKRANSFNQISAMLNPNSSGAEGANNNCDFVSNGFKWRTNDGNSNASATYIYMAFAENPFVTSSGIPTTGR